MKHLKYLLFLSLSPAFAQTTIVPPCTLNFTLSAAGSSNNFNNTPAACDKWTLTVYNVGFSGFSLTLQQAPAATTSTPGTFVTYAGTTATGSNPVTATGIATFTNGTVATPWLRVTLSGTTGSGTIYGVLQGSQTVVSKNGGGGGGNLTIAGTPSEIAVAGAGCTPSNSGTCTIAIPNNPALPGVPTAEGINAGTAAFSGFYSMNGMTSGNVTLAVANVAGTAIIYIFPSTNGTAGQVLTDSGPTTCPTLPAGLPSVCHQLTWGSGGSGFAVQVNGTALTGLTTLNLAAGTNMTLTPSGSGTYTVTFIASGASGTAGGDLSGTYPNPTVAKVNGNTPGGTCTSGQFVTSISTSGVPTCSTVATAGGGVLGWSSSSVGLSTAGTRYIPPAGGGGSSATEANVVMGAPAAAAISNLYVVLNGGVGSGNSLTITYRDNSTNTALTCTITTGNTCIDTTHSFTPAVGDTLSIALTTTGTVVVVPEITIIAEYGLSGSGGGVTSVGGLTGVVPGGWILLEQHVASNSSALQFTTCIQSGYDDYKIELVDVQTAASTSLAMQFSTNGGSSYDTSSIYYWMFQYWTCCGSGSGTVGQSNDTQLFLRPSNSDVSGNYPIQGSFTLYNPAGSGYKAFVGTQFNHNAADPAGPTTLISNAIYASNTAVNAFQFVPGTSTISAGTIRCYGVAKQ